MIHNIEFRFDSNTEYKLTSSEKFKKFQMKQSVQAVQIKDIKDVLFEKFKKNFEPMKNNPEWLTYRQYDPIDPTENPCKVSILSELDWFVKFTGKDNLYCINNQYFKSLFSE